ncbi:MAG: polysaccharide biosynthesis tyrosine autokinase [Acidobacteria bacterium]|nr:polysaccharide biosynthesis tyrosine autokinase [Acidobacteriota bacterium]
MIKGQAVGPTTDIREVHLMDYWRIFWRGRWTVAALFVVILTLVTIGTYLQTPIYQAQAMVEIQPRGRTILPGVQDVSPMGVNSWSWFGEQRYFNTQYEIIKSRDVARKVIEKLDLTNHPRFRGSSDPAGSLAGMVKVEPIEDTGIVLIKMTGPDPEEITLWTNNIAEAYVERNLEVATQSTLAALEQLKSAVEPMRQGVRESEKRQFAFVEQADSFVPENQKDRLEKRITQLQVDLTETDITRLELEGVSKKIAEVEKEGGSFLVIPRVASDLQVQNLNQERSKLERELNLLLVQYLPKHSKVIEKRSELEKVKNDIQAEMEQIVTNAKTEYALLVQKGNDLRQQIQTLKAESVQLTRRASEYQVLKSQSSQQKTLYDAITSRQQEINLNQALLSNNLRVLDRAVAPRSPIRPRKALNLIIGAMLGLMVGVGTVFFMDYMDNTVKTTEDVEQYLQLNLLSVIPRFREEDYRPVKEAFQTLRTSLLFSRRNRDHNTVLITSAGPQEGKTSIVVNLAKTLASAGEKVVIVDSDLRRPSIHEHLGLDRTSGLTNYLLSKDGEDWRAYLKVSGTPNLQAMTCGPIPPNPPELFGTERFIRLIEGLRQNFNWVLIDSPPVISLTDSIILSSLVDLIAIVVRHSQNDKEMIRRCVNSIRNVNDHVIGAVLNDVDLSRSHYSDYYYAGYYYYGADQEKTKKQKKVRASVG